MCQTLSQTSSQRGSALPTPVVSCSCRLGSRLAGHAALFSPRVQVNGQLRDLGACKWRRIREGAQPAKADNAVFFVGAYSLGNHQQLLGQSQQLLSRCQVLPSKHTRGGSFQESCQAQIRYAFLHKKGCARSTTRFLGECFSDQTSRYLANLAANLQSPSPEAFAVADFEGGSHFRVAESCEDPL